MNEQLRSMPGQRILFFARLNEERHYLWGLSILFPLALFALYWRQIEPIAAGAVLTWSLPWAPSLGLHLSFTLDGLSLIFGLLITGMGALVLLYANSYLAGDSQLARFHLFILIFMVAMLGLTLSGNILLLFIFWELTSISSYLLIGFKHASASARKSALQALLVTGGGGLALLAGLLLLGNMGGSFEIGDLTTRREIIHTHTLYAPAILLILLGAFTKSAQFPFHFWLPGAMAAPTPVSAYLHSATMVKAGVYLVARLTPILGGVALWNGSLVVVGALTFLIGAFIAWREQDLKRILAYSTVSALGALFLMLGVGTPVALKAAVVFLLAHALYKGALFMVAGNVDHATGTRNITELGGLGRTMPFTALAAVLAGVSMAGLPPLTGFVAKELLYETTLYAPQNAWVLTCVAWLASVLTVVAVGLVAVRPFWAAPTAVAQHAHDTLSLWFSPLLLAVLGLVGGLFIGATGKQLVSPAVTAIGGETAQIKLSLWHGINPMLILSVLTVAAGVGAYMARDRLLQWTHALRALPGPAAGYEVALNAMLRLANAQTRWLQHGYLRGYLTVVIMTMVVGVGFTLLTRSGLPPITGTLDVRLPEAATIGLMVVATFMAITARSRLTAIVALGVVGFGMTLLFLFFSAPDLAMTQFAVETLTVLLFVFVLYRLPRFANLSGGWTRLRDGVVALSAGALMTLLVLTVTAIRRGSALTDYFAEYSWTLAKGRNVVNVILVDFRALDTLGEIVVLAVAALGVFALIRMGEQIALPLGQKSVETAAPRLPAKSVILSTATTYLLPLMLLFSLFALLRGHNAPGGGFVGGLVAAAAFALVALSAGVRRARRTLGIELRTLIGAGLLVASVSGLVGLLLRLPFMTGMWSERALPVLGKMGTPLLFDLGVYLVVIGVSLLILFSLMEPRPARRLPTEKADTAALRTPTKHSELNRVIERG